ncbi:BAG family molecular chaperone regulator 7-like [Prosopis cineraria]|uniref:BAG family molecular chaperone regulator 7-like n=1 Tax=Prosopis cineraria TaxID=364024 RepID=UPI00240F00A3|nr:BAG family molecular chaperone regulator 7-like [Prosopis cineraria]
MRRFRRFEVIEEPCFFRETSIVCPRTLTFPLFIEEDLDVSCALDLFNFNRFTLPSPFDFDVNDVVTHLVRIDRTPLFKRVQRVERLVGTDFHLQSLSDRVAELESRFDRLVKSKGIDGSERKYTWKAEIKGPEEEGFDRKYQWVAEIVEEAKKKEEEKEKKKKTKCGIAKNFKWTAEIKGKGEDSGSSRKYKFEVECGDHSKKDKKAKEKKKGDKDQKKKNELRIVEIEEPREEGAVILRQAFAKRFGAVQNQRGKKKELSAQDAALLIQMSFRAYMIRRSKALRALRELAVAKSKLKEIRAQFNNFAYRRRLCRDAVERQKFSEKIIVLLLTVDAIEGVDMMVRSAKRSMVDELEAMLDVVDPQPAGRSLSIKRRTFDMPDGLIRKEIEEGVAHIVQMIDEADQSSSTFEAC